MMTFLLGYFRQINILGFISYSVVLYNLSQIDSEAFSSARGFFLKGFPRKSCVFPLFRIFFIVSSIITSGIRAIRFFLSY